MLKRIALLFLVCQISFALYGQNKQISYDFAGQPQALMLNPGIRVDYDMHIGVPFLSDAYMDFGSSLRDASYNSIFADTDGLDDILRNVYDLKPDKKDVFVLNQQLELISFGRRLNNERIYLSAGMYQEFNGFGSYPAQIDDLYMNGNDQDGDGVPEFEEEFGFGDLNGMGELLGVFHVGLNWAMNERLNLGARLKIQSGSIGFQSLNNSGTYALAQGINPYRHRFTGMDLEINTSGMLDPFGTNIIGKTSKLLKGLFFAPGNIGLGLDLGFSYALSDRIDLSASVLDLGMTNYKSEVTTYKLSEPDFVLTDQEYFDPPTGSESGYWKQKVQSFSLGLQLPLDTLASSFSQLRAPKVHAALKYDLSRDKSQGQSAFRNVRCEGCLGSRRISSAAGLQLFTEFRPSKPLWALTAFYYRELFKNFSGKFTYTVDRYSYYNLGAGFSYRFKTFQVFAAVDNLLALPKVRDSNYQSFQLGMSFVFNN